MRVAQRRDEGQVDLVAQAFVAQTLALAIVKADQVAPVRGADVGGDADVGTEGLQHRQRAFADTTLDEEAFLDHGNHGLHLGLVGVGCSHALSHHERKGAGVLLLHGDAVDLHQLFELGEDFDHLLGGIVALEDGGDIGSDDAGGSLCRNVSLVHNSLSKEWVTLGNAIS